MRAFISLYFVAFHVFASVNVSVLDQNGMPVENAVVSFNGVLSPSINPAELPSATMDQVSMQFRPHVLVVSQGQFVNFPNSDDTRHHVYSFSKAKTFEIKLFKGAEANPIEMTIPGIVELGCNIHDQMLGFIYVDASGTALKTDKNGQVSLPLLQSKPEQIAIWHPRLAGEKGQLVTFDIDSDALDSALTYTVNLIQPVEDSSTSGFKKRFKRSAMDKR